MDKLQNALSTLATAAQLAPLPYRDHLLCQEAVKVLAEALSASKKPEVKEEG
jgi:hypothetical protein